MNILDLPNIALTISDAVFKDGTKREPQRYKMYPNKIALNGRLDHIKAPGKIVVALEADNLALAVWGPATVWYGDILKADTATEEQIADFADRAMQHLRTTLEPVA